MLKLFPLLILSLILFQCGKKRPAPQPPRPAPTVQPQPTVEPAPVASPSPSANPIPIRWATPYPVPSFNPQSYIPAPRAGKTVTIASANAEEERTFTDRLQAAQDDPEVSKVIVGPGSLKRSTVWKSDARIELPKGTFLSCDQEEGLPDLNKAGIPFSNYGCILLADGVHVDFPRPIPKVLTDYFERGNGHLWRTDPHFQKLANTTDDQLQGDVGAILEPTFNRGPGNPGIEVFQALGDVLDSHAGKSRNIAITGVVIQGRQQMYDGGVRSSILLGNCENCTVQNALLRDTGSIGIQAGGTGGKGNFANNVLFRHNISSGVAAANIAIVNAENVLAIENYTRRPGRKGFGGGISAIDIETNSPNDHTKDLYILNNLADYENSSLPTGAGSAFLAQDPYTGLHRGKVVIANNVAIGGRDDIVNHHMSNGIFLVGLKQCEVINNYVYRTGQNAIQAYNLDGCLIQDNDFEHTGGGGASTVQFYGVRNTTIRRSHFRSSPNVPINVQAGFNEAQGSCGNKFEDNLIDGRSFTYVNQPCETLK